MTKSHHAGSFGSPALTLNMLSLAFPDSLISHRSRLFIALDRCALSWAT